MSCYYVYVYRLPKNDIEKIMATPFSILSRKEVAIRKLLSKYHDNVDVMKKKSAELLTGFDPHIAERVRSKDPKSFTREEWEFASVDYCLYPLVGYVAFYTVTLYYYL